MTNNKISDKEAMEAVKTLISWIGDDPTREGLIETPKRVISAYKEFFS
jgi:GTP cyclohydrolase I